VAFPSNIALVRHPARLAHLSLNQRRWLLLSLLALLHLLLLQGIESLVGRTLLVGHIGLFILWQPFVRAEQRLSGVQLALIVAGVAAAAWWINWWLMIFWVMVLAGIVGGKIFFFAARWTKVLYLLVLIYLSCVLLIFLVPQILPQPFVVPQTFLRLAQYYLPALFIAMALLPVEQEREDAAEAVDFIYSAFMFLVLAVLVLGSIAAMLLTNRNYIESLIQTILVLAGVLFVLAWAWNPRAGFAGLNTIFSRYLLSVGMPFERWLHHLADHAQREDQPDRFLDEAMSAMLNLPWVVGGEWHTDKRTGQVGRLEGRRNEFRHQALRITIYTRYPLGPSLVWHFDLLAQLLGEFFEAKQRGQELQQLSYVKAIHETGARLTHDVKNLLQSLNTLCFAAAREGDESSPQFQALLKRQLPVISQRLQQTLAKLKQPAIETTQYVPIARWWSDLRARYAQNGVIFELENLSADAMIPTTLFNSVAENLLENALSKRQAQADLQVRVRMTMEGPLTFSVWDNGAAVPEAVAADLFRNPVSSEVGLGIGLYQAARHAEFYGYDLSIASNRSGDVRFALSQSVEPGPAPV